MYSPEPGSGARKLLPASPIKPPLYRSFTGALHLPAAEPMVVPKNMASMGTEEAVMLAAGRLNKWFAGYFPYKEPKYALVTVSLDTTDNSSSMTALFSDIVEMVHGMNSQ